MVSLTLRSNRGGKVAQYPARDGLAAQEGAFDPGPLAPIPAGTDFLLVFRLTSVVAILGYGVSHIPDSIWKGHRWGVTFKFLLDGVVYGLATGLTFAWLWPRP